MTAYNQRKYEEFVRRWKQGLELGFKGRFGGISCYIRRYLFEKFHNKCARCGWCKINKFSGKIPLEVEHIDGNSENNIEKNLILLCPNCHSLTSTYRGLNKGKGRKERKYFTVRKNQYS